MNYFFQQLHRVIAVLALGFQLTKASYKTERYLPFNSVDICDFIDIFAIFLSVITSDGIIVR